VIENTPVYWTKIRYNLRGFSLWKDGQVNG